MVHNLCFNKGACFSFILCFKLRSYGGFWVAIIKFIDTSSGLLELHCKKKKEILCKLTWMIFLLILKQCCCLIHTWSGCPGLWHIVVFLWNRKTVFYLSQDWLNLLSDIHVKNRHCQLVGFVSKKPVRSFEYLCWREIKVFMNGTERTVIRSLRIHHVINSWGCLWLTHGL